MVVCCENCFYYKPFKKHIQEVGKVGECSFCDSKNIRTLDIQDRFFDVNMFQFAHIFTPNEEGVTLQHFFTEDIYLLSNDLSLEFATELIYQLLRTSINREVLYGKFAVSVNKDIYESWVEFKENIQHGNRFGFAIDPELKLILEEILQINELHLRAGQKFNRARLGKIEGSIRMPYENDQIMSPPKHLVNEGRINPRGIPYLYLANDVETSIAEVRPYKGKEVSVATIETRDRIRISTFNDAIFPKKPLNKQYQLYSLTHIVNTEFSKPVSEETRYFNYIPTQYVAELAKYLQFEGIAYKSGLTGGVNYCLFNQEKVSWVESKLYVIKNVYIEHDFVEE